MTDMPMIDTPSPNFDDRKLPISMLVLHYTGMPDAPSAINWLASGESKVSAHYVVTEAGEIVRMVDEGKRAWHAGRSHWRGINDVNSASIGIEIVNPGHEWGYRPFPEAQIGSLIPLMHDIVQRHGITRGNIVGHSDVAPARKDFIAQRAAGIEIDERLEMRLDLVVADCDPQIVLQRRAFMDALVHAGLEEGKASAAIALGAVECDVGAPQQGLGVAPIAGRQGRAQGRADRHFVGAE